MPNTRRTFMKNSLLGATALALTNPALSTQAASGYGIVGQKAPELDIDYWIDGSGKSTSFKLSQHKNKWIFLKCFQSWCPGCHSHGLPALKKISDAMQDNPKIVFAAIQTVFEGFSTNTRDKVRKTQLQYDLQIPMGHDAGSEGRAPATMVNFRTGGTPWMILINPQGLVVYNEFNIDADKAIEYLSRETASFS